jgi:predicted ATPase/DNA-binding SARP family transcriptional activator
VVAPVEDRALEFRLLGPLEAWVDDRPLALGGTKQRVLLALLLLNANEAVSRERAVDAVWDEDPPGRPEAALQVFVHHLRRSLGADTIITHGRSYLLRTDAARVDVLQFERLAVAARSLLADHPTRSLATLNEALGLWRGKALADLPAVSFVAAERSRLAEARLGADELRYEARLALGESESLVPELELFIRENPLREHGWAQLMLALYRAGRQGDALQVARRLRAQLDEELGLEPGPQVRELERAILRHDVSLTLRSPRKTTRELRLPRPQTPLVGRRLEIAAVTALLADPELRILTLLGPGGVGKTRLAIAAAVEVGESFADGAVFVDLTNVFDADLLPSAIATAVGVAPAAGADFVDELVEKLAPQELILVLDNFEQIVEAAPVLSRLSAGAPELRLLVTSRSPLRLNAERVYTVPPLAVADPDESFEAIAGSDAVRVFLARARTVDPSFQLTDENAAAVAEICRLLDGLPLAIELAAARGNLLSPGQLLERLAEPLELLTAGDRDSPARHQTMRATVEWSYELLTPAQRQLFEQLAVFVGGCTFEAVHDVCSPDLDSFAALLDNSLLVREQRPGQEPRFQMLVPVRSLAVARLRQPTREVLRERHAAYYLQLVEQAMRETTARRGREAEVFEALEQDHDNLRAALRWAEERHEVDALLRLTTAMRLFWNVRGHLEEGCRWFELALDARGAGTSPHRVAALAGGGTLAFRRGDYALARRWWEEARERLEQTDDASSLARTLGDLASLTLVERDLNGAYDLWQRAAEQLRMGTNDIRLATVLANLGVVSSALERHQDAVEFLEEALELSRGLQDRSIAGPTLFNLGRAHVELGAIDVGERTIRDALQIADELGYRELAAYCLLGLADVAATRGEIETAERRLAASDDIVATVGIGLQQEDLAVRERTLERIRLANGDSDPWTPERADVRGVIAEALGSTPHS